MKVKSDVIKENITSALQKSHHGASSTELESLTPYERHTISKYLLILRQEGLVEYKQAGPAKFWFLIKSPLKAITQMKSAKRTYL